jgi:RNA recognition motif-containing protein
MNIYVGNLSYTVNDDDLRKVFEDHGEVESARVIKDRDTSRSKGFAFVEMPNDDEAKSAIDAVNGSEIGGRAVKVNEARPRSNDRGGKRRF